MNIELSEFIGFNKGSVSDPRVLWESVKGFIRSFSIRFASNLNKNCLLEIKKLEKKLLSVESRMHDTLSSQSTQEREVTGLELNSLLRHTTEFKIHRTRCNFYFNSSRPSRLLVQKLRKNENLSSISCIIDEMGNSLVNPVDISSTFANFFFPNYIVLIPL